MVKVEGKGGISAKVVADSVSPSGKRITTFELDYPRFCHSEFMTHRLFSRNAASSRAIPVPKMIEHIKANTAMPIHWGANQKGMQADSEIPETYKERDLMWEEWDEFPREKPWIDSRDQAIYFAEKYHRLNAHKQIVNRLLEPFQFIKVVCTATEYDNFFWLRNHKDAQPEIKELAACMWEAREQSKPIELRIGEWHLPYIKTIRMPNYGGWNGQLEYTTDYTEFNDEYDTATWTGLSLEDARKVSASCCAQVSYRLTDQSLEKAIKIYDMLVNSKPVHASPFEHQAKPMSEDTDLDELGVTGYNKRLGYSSGNFFGWIQFRQLIPDNACWDYESE